MDITALQDEVESRSAFYAAKYEIDRTDDWDVLAQTLLIAHRFGVDLEAEVARKRLALSTRRSAMNDQA